MDDAQEADVNMPSFDLYSNEPYTQEIGFHVIPQRSFHVNIPTSRSEVIPHFEALSEKCT